MNITHFSIYVQSLHLVIVLFTLKSTFIHFFIAYFHSSSFRLLYLCPAILFGSSPAFTFSDLLPLNLVQTFAHL